MPHIVLNILVRPVSYLIQWTGGGAPVFHVVVWLVLEAITHYRGL